MNVETIDIQILHPVRITVEDIIWTFIVGIFTDVTIIIILTMTIEANSRRISEITTPNTIPIEISTVSDQLTNCPTHITNHMSLTKIFTAITVFRNRNWKITMSFSLKMVSINQISELKPFRFIRRLFETDKRTISTIQTLVQLSWSTRSHHNLIISFKKPVDALSKIVVIIRSLINYYKPLTGR